MSNNTEPFMASLAQPTLFGRELELGRLADALNLSFFDYLGARLGVPDAPIIAPLPDLVRASS